MQADREGKRRRIMRHGDHHHGTGGSRARGAAILVGTDRKVRQRRSPVWVPWWIAREQVPLAISLALAWLGVVLWWVLHGGCSGRTIDFDQASPLRAEFRVDVNAADWPEFAQLPGVGETLARRIVEYRASHGPFQSLQELRRVPGIGVKTLDRIMPFLVIDPPSRLPPSKQEVKIEQGALRTDLFHGANR